MFIVCEKTLILDCWNTGFLNHQISASVLVFKILSVKLHSFKCLGVLSTGLSIHTETTRETKVSFNRGERLLQNLFLHSKMS